MNDANPGWEHIAPAHAATLNQFDTGFLNPCVNDHRPSVQAEVQIDAKDRRSPPMSRR